MNARTILGLLWIKSLPRFTDIAIEGNGSLVPVVAFAETMSMSSYTDYTVTSQWLSVNRWALSVSPVCGHAGGADIFQRWDVLTMACAQSFIVHFLISCMTIQIYKRLHKSSMLSSSAPNCCTISTITASSINWAHKYVCSMTSGKRIICFLFFWVLFFWILQIDISKTISERVNGITFFCFLNF